MLARLLMQTSTVGGSSDTDMNELAVIAYLSPCGLPVVTMVTVAATPRMASRSRDACPPGLGMTLEAEPAWALVIG